MGVKTEAVLEESGYGMVIILVIGRGDRGH